MQDFELIREQDLVDNPSARVAVCLCLDVSGSMTNYNAIHELNEGIAQFYEAIKNDEEALYAAEVCIVTFGGNNQAMCEADFSTLSIQGEPPVLTANGNTPMGEGVRLALDLLDKRKQEYKDKGVDYYQPWLVLMSDGQPNGNVAILEDAIQRTRDLVVNKKLSLFPIGIGADADMDALARFSPIRPPLRLKGLNFKDFFEWLSKSISRVSQSTPVDKVPLDLEGVRAWGEA